MVKEETMNEIYHGYVDSFKMSSRWFAAGKHTPEKAPDQVCNSISQYPEKNTETKDEVTTEQRNLPT